MCIEKGREKKRNEGDQVTLWRNLKMPLAAAIIKCHLLPPTTIGAAQQLRDVRSFLADWVGQVKQLNFSSPSSSSSSSSIYIYTPPFCPSVSLSLSRSLLFRLVIYDFPSC